MGRKSSLVERLLFSANDRSCEEFPKYSSENIQDEELAVFYRINGVCTTFITYMRKYGVGIDVENVGECISFENIIKNYGKNETIHGNFHM
jgi:tRNA-(ms[2]io[6]A)-hydroxylase